MEHLKSNLQGFWLGAPGSSWRGNKEVKKMKIQLTAAIVYVEFLILQLNERKYSFLMSIIFPEFIFVPINQFVLSSLLYWYWFPKYFHNSDSRKVWTHESHSAESYESFSLWFFTFDALCEWGLQMWITLSTWSCLGDVLTFSDCCEQIVSNTEISALQKI